MTRTFVLGALAMALIVVASNILVQFLVGEWLTWGAFVYPFAFLVTDLMNRAHGPSVARRIVTVGFAVGVVCSLIGSQFGPPDNPLVPLRIALASGTAFLVAQLLDVVIFDRLRDGAWWRAPLASTILGSLIDTFLFFGIAFSATMTFLSPQFDVAWAADHIALLGAGPVVPYWLSLASADLLVKLSIALVALVPFRLISTRMLVARRQFVD